MDYKRSNAPLNTVTRDVIKLSQDTGNVYETVCIIAKRANQIAVEMKKDLEKKLQEFATLNDNLEEVSENRERADYLDFFIASKKDAEIQLAKAERFQALVTEYFKNKGIY